MGETSRNLPVVLVVDDDAAIRLLSREMLEQAGFDVIEAEDGAGALSLNIGVKIIENDVALPLQLPRAWEGVHEALDEGVYVDVRVKLGVGHKQGVALSAGTFEAHLSRSFIEIRLKDSLEDFTLL